MNSENFLFAMGLTIFAGLSTGIGSLMAFLSKKFNPKFLALSLGFSAGVMIYISLIEIFPTARETLSLSFGQKSGYWFTVIAFFAGIGLIALIDRLIPSYENPHEIHKLNENSHKSEYQNHKLYRLGLFSAIAIAIHNFPEGLATFLAALNDPTMGISIAIAVAIHNIPEGVAVSVPIYFATKNKSKAFWLSFTSGLAEPVGALAGYFILRTFMGEGAFGFIFAGVAGIMIYISLDELLPTAEEYGEHHIAIGGLVGGMMVMAVSLLLFA
ncbi:MAG: zinc transporter ZupT [Bacteroidales bacterium]|nr:zinc transporter ZupT [Bacteroidales bacterium]